MNDGQAENTKKRSLWRALEMLTILGGQRRGHGELKMKARQPEQLALKFYRNWAVAKDVVEDAQKDLAAVVKDAAHALEVAEPAFKLACRWHRNPNEAIPQIRYLRKLCYDFGLTDENFRPLQSDLEDAIRDADPVL